MINVERCWCNYESKLKAILKRPRVDYRISEYVVDCIYKTIPQLDKILAKNYYNITLSFHTGGFIKERDDEKNYALYGMSTIERLEAFGHFTDWDYYTDDTEYWIYGKRSTLLDISCYSSRLNNTISPREYADITHNMVSVLLKHWYKRVTKEIMDENKNGMDYDYIESFGYPAAFENQKYANDLESLSACDNGGIINIAGDIKAAYKKHYKE
ncbi:MAG: hypothetical protein FWE42_04135 [Defluviitaleaceae bacterium]|nr:hypothetical protein [Defluviitaleaceae bacterium]